MGIDSIECLRVFGIPIVGLAVVIIGTIWFFHDIPVNRQRFSWQQLLANNIYVSYIDSLGKTWVMEIDYNAGVGIPTCEYLSTHKVKFLIPTGYHRAQFVDFINGIPETETELNRLVKGITHENFLDSLHFGKEDLAIYRDFKRHLLLKALKG